MLMRICCFLAPPELGELGKPGSLARRLALGRPLALLCGLVRGIIRLIIVNYIRVAVPMADNHSTLIVLPGSELQWTHRKMLI